MKHLYQNLEGIENMAQLPDAMFVIDSNAEEIAVKEARRMGVPVVSVVDTNCDPDVVDWIIPGNDDALRAIRLFTSKIQSRCWKPQPVSAIASGGPKGRGRPGSGGRRRVRRHQRVRTVRETRRRFCGRRSSGGSPAEAPEAAETTVPPDEASR